MKSEQWFSRLMDLMARLRGPAGCPWDREQTLQSLRPFILEEAYELVDAIDRSVGTSGAGGGHANDDVKEELGDLLLEVVFVAQIAREQAAFQPEEFIRQVHDKIIRRHRHVFGDERIGNAAEALTSWEEAKAQEKKPRDADDSVLDGVALALPALVRAHKLSSRAARQGFDWQNATQVRAKIDEELGELDEAIRDGDKEHMTQELGDVLCAIVNLARHLQIDPEQALMGTNRKFISRFRSMETALRVAGKTMDQTALDDLERLWQLAKKAESED